MVGKQMTSVYYRLAGFSGLIDFVNFVDFIN